MCKSWSHVDYLCCIGALLCNGYQHLAFILVGGGGLMALLRVKENDLIMNVRDQL